MPTLGQIIERNARQSPDQLAIVYQDRRLTHRQYAGRVRKLASALQQLGLRRQDRFSVMAMNCSEYLELCGAAEWAGFVLNTLNWRLAPAEIADIVNDAAPRILVFEEQYADLVGQIRPALDSIEHYICIGDACSWAAGYESLLEAGDPVGPDFRAREEDHLCLIYTSGTTGRPKGVIQDNRGYAALSEIISSELKLGGDGRLLAMAPLFHIGARSLASGQQWRGGTIVLHRSFDAQEVIRTIERERITAIHLVPTMVQALLDAPNIGQHDLSSLQMLMYAAAPMPVPLLKRALQVFGPIMYNGFGQTEINLMSVLHPHQHLLEGSPEQTARLGSVGQPHPRCEIRIVDDEGRECAAGVAGEITARSETAMVGYWNNSTATADTVRDGWVHTGDVGYLDDQGYLFLVDRKKDMIITGGENVYSREVEDTLLAHAAVADVAVIGVPDEKWGEAVTAIVVLRPGQHALEQELIAHCKTRIASYKCPRTVELVDALPRLPTGKLNKVELRKQYRKPQGLINDSSKTS